MIFLTLFCFLEFNRSNNQKEFCNQSSINLKNYYSEIGFYRVLIRNSDKINVFLNGGKQRLYFFIPYDLNFLINDIVIDGIRVYREKFNISGLSIEGNGNATIGFFKFRDSDNEIEANFWILPSTMCQKNSGYVFGSKIIEVHSDLDQLCIFSPSFDSINSQFDIKSGIPFADGYHYSRVYTNDFENPTYVNNGNKIEKYKLKTANFVSFYSANFTLKYKRSVRKYSDLKYFFLNYCTANSVYKCSKYGCSSADVFKSINCSNYTTDEIAFNVIFIACMSAILFICVVILLIKLIKKKNNSRLLNEQLNTVPLNNENEYYTQQDLNENENYAQQDLNENEYYAQQDLNPSNENDYIRYKNVY